MAAASIFAAAIPRLINPKPLEQVGPGLAVSVVASLINLSVARVLLRASKQYNSITLEADGQHLMTDVWTSVGVLVGIVAVVLTGWERLDPIIAILAAANIVWSGVNIVRKTILGLMDTALPIEDQNKLKKTLEPYVQNGIQYHALRTRQSGALQFVSLHVLVPDEWTIKRGHQLLESMEADIRRAMPNVIIFTHLEPLDDPVSWNDASLDRTETPPLQS